MLCFLVQLMEWVLMRYLMGLLRFCFVNHPKMVLVVANVKHATYWPAKPTVTC
jgi:hypothetical protein